MGLLEGTHEEYYQGSELGNYQFISLDDIIKQFQIAYVGEDKIISKIKRADVAYHAQRAMQELSFDTFKSIKSYQIDIPNSLTIPLPHDYVNYTKLTWTDSAGIKHPLYPTNRTSNPFQIRQEDDDGEYVFPEGNELVTNYDFTAPTTSGDRPAPPWYRNALPQTNNYATIFADYNITNDVMRFSHRTRTSGGSSNWGHAMSMWQEIDVSDVLYVDIKATATAVDMTNGPGVLRFGISTKKGDINTRNLNNQTYSTSGTNHLPEIFDLEASDNVGSYLEWRSEDGTDAEKELLKIDVREYNKIYVLIVSYQEFSGTSETLTVTNYVNTLSVVNAYASTSLQPKIGNETESSTWKNYKSTTPSENNNDDYEDDAYWPIAGERYGLDPQHAQANGSFFIDPRLGKIHFSSNISGKTVILDYISDSLGTDAEMQVHKFAEEAMYKSILCAIMSAKANVGRGQLLYYKRDRFAAVRQAKLRLSNIKLEELTQILRGKSKHIKH